MYVMKWCNPSALAHDEMNNEIMKWTMKRWIEQWNDETLEGLSTSVRYTKWPSALAYDEKMKWKMKLWYPRRIK